MNDLLSTHTQTQLDIRKRLNIDKILSKAIIRANKHKICLNKAKY
jgi:hypothetical protein